MRLADLLGDAPYVSGPDTTIREAAGAMEGSDLGSLAVVEGHDLIGLGHRARHPPRRLPPGPDLDAPVSSVMSRDPDTFDPDLDVWDAAAWIAESGVPPSPCCG